MADFFQSEFCSSSWVSLVLFLCLHGLVCQGYLLARLFVPVSISSSSLSSVWLFTRGILGASYSFSSSRPVVRSGVYLSWLKSVLVGWVLFSVLGPAGCLKGGLCLFPMLLSLWPPLGGESSWLMRWMMIACLCSVLSDFCVTSEAGWSLFLSVRWLSVGRGCPNWKRLSRLMANSD